MISLLCRIASELKACMELPEKEATKLTATCQTEPWTNRWTVDESQPSKGGNQSSVRRVRETHDSRQGALKTLNKPSNSERRARMVREVEILGKLNGIYGIPKVFDHNTSAAEEENFVVLEWVDGKPMSERFTGKVSIDQSAEIGLKLCTIVQQCHERGIIHRDIKPDNIMISGSSNDLWLIDFGIGWTESDDDPFATEINQELGNRFLRLPELHGPTLESKHDFRSDVTFVSGVFFWLLTHSRPYQLVNEVQEPPHVAQASRFPRDVLSDPRWKLVNSIFDVGFAPNVNTRFQAASELFVRLKELLEPPTPTNPNDTLTEQDRLLIELYNRADFQHRQKIETGIFDTSTNALRKMDKMARDRSLAPTSSYLSAKLPNGAVYFQFGLKFSEGDSLVINVCHWIRITGTNNSYVEASFDFTDDPRVEDFPAPYYKDSVSDITRLRSAVDAKANEIFAGLSRRLQEKFS
jgi:serine/threonine protein kinase